MSDKPSAATVAPLHTPNNSDLPAPSTHAPQRRRRGSWLKTLYRWHWISSAIALFGMLVFALTGVTLNHAGAIEARPSIHQQQLPLPPALGELLRARATQHSNEAPLPPTVRQWLNTTFGVRPGARAAEWSAEEIYLALPRPGGDAWLRIDLEQNEVEYEVTRRGWIAWLNDLHKGRNTGAVWSAFIDLFALACVLFSVTGLLILKAHAANRALVWPMVGVGIVIPALLALFFIH